MLDIPHVTIEHIRLRLLRLLGAATNEHEFDDLRVYALPNERVLEVVLTDGRRFRYDPETRTLIPVPADPDRITIREGADNRVIQAFEYTNRWENVTMANLTNPNPTNPTNEQLVNQLRAIPPEPDNIQVRVARNDYGGWVIYVRRNGVDLSLPDINVIKSLLPPEWKRLLGGRHSRRRRTIYYLNQALDSGLPTQVLHDTLQAWAFTYVSSINPVESDTSIIANEDESFLLKAQPATIFVGGKSFKLVPTGERDNTNIYRHIRDKAKAIAQIEVQAKLDKANTDARILISEAQDRANRARAEVESLRASLGNQAPEWARLSGRPIKLYNGRWYVGLRVTTYIEDIRYRVDRWHSTLHWTPIHPNNEDYYSTRPMPMWLLLGDGGAYNMNSVVSDIWQTVHTSTRACMELQGIPTRINNMTDLNNLERAISRGVRVINFNSPLSMSLPNFYPLYVEQLPEMVKKLISGDAIFPGPDNVITPENYLITANQGRPANDPRISWDRIETDARELEYTFEVRG